MAEFMMVPDGNLMSGQRVTLTVTGVAVGTDSIKIGSVAITKKGKMNIQEVLLSQMNDRLRRIEEKSVGQRTVV